MSTVLTVSDLHCPWQHPGAFDFLADLKRRHRPKLIVILGDEIDACAFSRYARNPDQPGAADEWRGAVAALQTLYKVFPKAVVCEGNHTLRPAKRASDAGLPEAFLKELHTLLEAPRSWHWVPRYEHEGVLYLHGDGFTGKNAALNAAERFRRNVVIGHVHAYAGVQYSTGHFDRVWGMNAGCLIDPEALCFSYARHFAQRPTLGTGLVVEGVPHFEPMPGTLTKGTPPGAR